MYSKETNVTTTVSGSGNAINLANICTDLGEKTGLPVQKVGVTFYEGYAGGSTLEPCMDLHIFLDPNELAKRFGDQARGPNAGLSAFGITPAKINLDAVHDQIAAALKQRGLVTSTRATHSRPLDSQMGAINNPFSQPANYIIGKDGSIVYISTEAARQAIHALPQASRVDEQAAGELAVVPNASAEITKPNSDPDIFYGHLVTNFRLSRQSPEMQQQFIKLQRSLERSQNSQPLKIDGSDVSQAAQHLLEHGPQRVNQRSPFENKK